MPPVPRLRRGPLLAGLALFAASGAWALIYWHIIRERELAQLERLSGGLAVSVGVLLDPHLEPLPEDDAGIERLLRNKLSLRRPVLYVGLLRDGHPVATVGDVPDTVGAPWTPGPAADGALAVFRRPLSGAALHGAKAWPASAAFVWQPSGVVPDLDLELVVGCETALPEHVYAENIPEMAFALAVGWAGIIALVLAWQRSIRSHELARALESERTERARLEEMGLVATGLAHETKNPLGLILGLAQHVCRDPGISAETRVAAERIVDAADQAAARLSDFLTFARSEPLRLEPTRADALLQNVAGALRGDFDDAGVRLDVQAPPLTLQCAPMRVEQVLVNLLLNSLQASRRGSTVSLRLEPRGDGAALVVEDQGTGIPHDILPDVFKPYVTGRPDGHGLGLAIVKRVVDLHGWSITIDSRPRQGTCVTISGLRRPAAEETP